MQIILIKAFFFQIFANQFSTHIKRASTPKRKDPESTIA